MNHYSKTNDKYRTLRRRVSTMCSTTVWLKRNKYA